MTNSKYPTAPFLLFLIARECSGIRCNVPTNRSCYSCRACHVLILKKYVNIITRYSYAFIISVHIQGTSSVVSLQRSKSTQNQSSHGRIVQNVRRMQSSQEADVKQCSGGLYMARLNFSTFLSSIQRNTGVKGAA